MAKSRLQWYGQKIARQTMSGAQKGVNEVTKRVAEVAAGNLTKGSGVDRGKLKRNIKATRAKRVGGKIIGQAGPTKRAFYGKFVEAGAKAHKIAPKTKTFLAFRASAVAMELGTRKSLYVSAKSGRLVKQRSRAAMVFARQVKHPGMSATHYLSRALDTVWPEAPGIIARAGRQAMSK